MTLSTSKYNRYSIDERLTIEPSVAMQYPLKPLDSESEPDDTGSVPCTDAYPKQSASSQHRSIFSMYWKTNRRLSGSVHTASQTCNEVKTPKQPQRRRIHKTFSYTYDRDPYVFFGIEEDGSKTSTTFCDDDSVSLNSYEFNLLSQEAGVGGKNCRRIRTCPSLLRARAGVDGISLESREKMTQSDPVLYANTSSCLRKSRFCFDADTSNNDGKEQRTGGGKGKIPLSVSFESKIKIRLFEPPIENWAPSGWSNWFGPWH